MLFVMGMMLAIGVVNETGALVSVRNFIDNNIHNVWVIGLLSGMFSIVIDTFANAFSWFSLFDMTSACEPTAGMDTYQAAFAQNGVLWRVVAYTSAVGGNILAIGSLSGIALVKMERMRISWFFRNVGWKALAGGGLGFLVMLAL